MLMIAPSNASGPVLSTLLSMGITQLTPVSRNAQLLAMETMIPESVIKLASSMSHSTECWSTLMRRIPQLFVSTSVLQAAGLTTSLTPAWVIALLGTSLIPQPGNACICVLPTPFPMLMGPTGPASIPALQATSPQRSAESACSEPVPQSHSTTTKTSKTTNAS